MEKQEKNGKDILATLQSHRLILPGLVILVLCAILGFGYYFYLDSGRVYIEKAEISAPLIELAPILPGTLEDVLVHVGDRVSSNAAVAKVGDDLVKAKAGGEIVSTKNDIGKIFNRGESVVTMIDPQELRLVGRIEEDKGLKDIRVGQRVEFTVDAFGSQKYYGTVDEISPTSRESGISFNISDKREVKEFEVKVRFNIDRYSELKNGMSAKMWVYQN